MHVVHIIARLKTYSGAEHLAFRYFREALARGDRVTLVTRHVPEDLRPHIPPGVEVRTLRFAHRPTRLHFFESISDVAYSLFLFRLVPRASDCDVYWNDSTLASLFLDSLLRTKLRMFYCLQLPHFAYGQTWLVTRSYPPLSWLVPIFVPIYRWLDRLFARRADSIVTLSRSVQKDCAMVYPRKPVFTVNPGVVLPSATLSDPSFIRRTFPIDSRQILVTAGKLIPKKNIPLFVEILAGLRSRGLDVAGVVVGDGPMRSEIELSIARHGLEEACLLAGFIPSYEDVLRIISGASLYLYLERRVPFGLTPIEAGAVGVPVVAFEGGGVEETVADGVNGWKIPEDWGAEQITELLASLLNEPDKLLQQGREGRRMAAERTWSRSYADFAQLIESRAGLFRMRQSESARAEVS